MSTTTVTSNDKIAGMGTLGFHAVLIALLFLVKCPGTGGGGGNDGYGNSGYMSMDVAGIGNSVDGWGETEDAQSPETTTKAQPVVEESPAVTDNQASQEAPVVNTNKPKPTQTNTVKPVNPTPQPEKKPDPKPSKGLSDALGNLGGKGNTSGSGNQGSESGQIDGRGVLGGGGSTGSGGGQGGGQGTGNGTGKGAGSGSGTGGGNYSYKLDGKITSPPRLDDNFDKSGTVVVDIKVDSQGNVVYADVNRQQTNVTNSELYQLAIKSAKTAKFSKSDQNVRVGTITIHFKV